MKKRGGKREGAGAKTKSVDGKRVEIPIYCSPKNAAFLNSMGRGKSDYINSALDYLREVNETIKKQ